MKKIILIFILPLTLLMAEMTLTGTQLSITDNTQTPDAGSPDTGTSKTNWGFQPFAVPSNSVTVQAGENIQTAINSLPNGGTVKLSVGVFNITSTIELKSNIVLEGAGRDKTKLKFTGSSPTRIMHLSSTTGDKYNVIIRGMEIDATGMGDMNALDFYKGVHNILIEDVEIYGGGRGNITFYGLGMSSGSYSHNITIRNVISHDNGHTSTGHCLSLRYSQNVKIENYEAYNTDNGIGLDLSHVHWVEVANVYVHAVDQGMKFPGSTYVYAHDITIRDTKPAVTHSSDEYCIQLNRGADANPSYMHIESVNCINSKLSLVDWGDGAKYPLPTFEQLVLKDIINTNVTNNPYSYSIRGVNNLYEYANSLNTVVSKNSGTIIRRPTTTSPESDGVGYSSWGHP